MSLIPPNQNVEIMFKSTILTIFKVLTYHKTNKTKSGAKNTMSEF